MPFDAATTTNPVKVYESADARVVTIDTSSDAGRAVMRAMLADSRRRRELAPALIRLQEAISCYRKTQRNMRTGYVGYFATLADARVFVRERLAEARHAVADFEAREARRAA